MTNTIREPSLRRQVEGFRRVFGQCQGGALDRVLTAESMEQVLAQTCGRYRERTYPPLTTLRLFVEQVLSADRACQDVVGRHLSERVATGQPECSLNTGPYCKARDRMPIELPRRLMAEIGRQLEAQAPTAWRWHGRSVKIFDGTTVSMPDTADNQEAFPQSSEQKPGLGFPVARIGGLIALASGAVMAHAVVACKGKGTGEQTLLRQLMPQLERGDVLLADALLTTWWNIAQAQALGVDVLMVQHARRVTDFSHGTRLGHKDHTVSWPRPHRPPWMGQAAYDALPMHLTMREVEVGGRFLVTTMLNRTAVSPEQLDALYAMRWNIEVDFRTIKADLEMDILRCKQHERVEKEIAVYLLAYNLVRWAMATAATLGHVLPRALSFMGAKRVLTAFAEQLRHYPGKRPHVLIAIVLGAMASLEIPHRPGRVEPRAKKRRPKPLPLLTEPRTLARQRIRQNQRTQNA